MLIKLLGIEAGKGASTPGAEDGPFALRRLGLRERLAEQGHKIEDLGDIPGVFETRFAGTSGRLVNSPGNVLQVNRHTHACILGTRRKDHGTFLLVIGGDHSLAIGTLAGLSDACQRLGLLWIDAHGDFNTPASSPSGSIHGMALAVACGRGLSDMRTIADRDPIVKEEDVYLFGCRDLDPSESTALAASRVHVLASNAWRDRGLITAVTDACKDLSDRCDHIHLSFDIDVIDAAHVLGTGTPVAGGLQPEEALGLLREIGRTGLIGSAEFVEYNPKLDADGRTGELMIQLILALFTPR